MKYLVTLAFTIIFTTAFIYSAYANDNLLYISDIGWVITEPTYSDDIMVLGSAYSSDQGILQLWNEIFLPEDQDDNDIIHTYYGSFRFTNRFVAHATAYSPEQPYLSPYTASGLPFVTGIVAVDPTVIPLGTYIYVPNFGLFLAADTGGAIRGKTVDLSFDTIHEALQFGRRDVIVYVLDKFTDLF